MVDKMKCEDICTSTSHPVRSFLSLFLTSRPPSVMLTSSLDSKSFSGLGWI